LSPIYLLRAHPDQNGIARGEGESVPPLNRTFRHSLSLIVNKYMQLPTSLTQYLLQHLSQHPDQKDLVLMMSELAVIGKIISKETNRAGLSGILGAVGMTNIQEEQVQKLDVFANELCKSYLKNSGYFAALASEEEEHVVNLEKSDAQYIIAFDPLDGSSNIDVNVSIGTIFSVLRVQEGMPAASEQQFFQKASAQVLAGYLLYGSSTVLVFSFGAGVHEFTLDQTVGEFLLSRGNIQLPEGGQTYSVNEGNTRYFSSEDKRFIDALKFDRGMSSRYVGSLVADFHRTLLTGGIFLYPGIDKDGSGVYKGKLRLNYEVKPLAFMLAQAGGYSTDGQSDLVERVPVKLHERVPFIFGNRALVEAYQNERR